LQEEDKQRNIERWKKSIRELPEELFFSIMRTYLGRLSTPFHKHKLAERLAAFLSKEETIRRIIKLVDEDDARILTAVDLLAGAGGGELYRLLEDEYDYFTFYAHLLNLQERLLLYSETETGALHLTPQLSSVLREEVLSTALLFPVRRSAGGRDLSTGLSGDAPWLREELIWALAAFFRRNPAPFKHDGELRKKRREEIVQVFPALGGEEGEERTQLLLKAVFRLRFFHRRNSRVDIDHERLEFFTELPRRSRHLFLWAAAVLPAEEPFREITLCARVIGDVLEAFPQGELAEHHLRRLITLLTYRHRGSMESRSVTPEKLRAAGLIGGQGQWYRRIPLSVSLDENEEVQQPLILHSDFTATTATPLPFSAGLFLADLFELRTFTVYPQIELTKNSFTACRMHFDSFEQFISRMEELSSSSLPPNIRSSLNNWEQNYSGVSLTRGIVLRIDTGRKHLVEHNEALNDYMLEVLGEGTYLFRDDAPETLLQLLSEAGVDPLPPIGPQPNRHTFEHPGSDRSGDFPPVEAEETLELNIDQTLPKLQSDELHKEREQLMQRIDSLSVDQSTREALERLVQRKVIIFSSQIRSDLQSQKMSEARGIDYAGKVRVVEETMNSNWDVLEVVERDAQGEPIRHLLRPVKLQKMGNDLLLIGREFPEMEEVQLRVRKLSYVRRWRNSLIISPEESPRR